MSELAFDKEGNPFRFLAPDQEAPTPSLEERRPARDVRGGAGPDGEPVILDADAEHVEFRAALMRAARKIDRQIRGSAFLK